MAVGYKGVPELYPVEGVRLGTCEAGIRYPDRRDLVVVELAEGVRSAAVFTRNLFCAAPVLVARRHLEQSSPRYLVINTGNANAGTGEQGMQDALAICEEMAYLATCKREQVLPFSTGVIGEPLPMEPLRKGLPAALEALDTNGWEQAAHGIMTTDTVAKAASRRFELGGDVVTVTGIAKGAGMIRPDMATMLAFIATDLELSSDCLQAAVQKAADASFNRITIDGDTSTNDACVLIATGRSGVRVDKHDDGFDQFLEELTALFQELAQLIIRDGEGATKFITVEVEEGAEQADCTQIAYTIAHSPLVKTALFAGDPNWGRILAAVGRSGVQRLNLDKVNIFLDEVCIVRAGARADDYTEARGQDVMARDEITIRVALGAGHARDCVWTSDLSYDYVRINAEYRT